SPVSHSHKPASHRKADPPASGGKLKLSLTALSSAAVLAIYSAGYMRTKAAAERFDDQSAPPRPGAPATPGAAIARGGGPGPSLGPAAVPAPVPATIGPAPATTTNTAAVVPTPATTTAAVAPA